SVPQAGDFLAAAQEPRRRPYPVQAPAEQVEHLRAQSVAIARGAGALVIWTVAGNTEEKLCRPLRIEHAQVEAKGARADLGHRLIAHAFQLRSNVAGQGTGRGARLQARGTVGLATALSVIEILAQMRQPGRLAGACLQVGGLDGADDDQLLACPRDGDVEPAGAPLPVDRPEIQDQLAGGILAVADAQKNDIAFIPLHSLQVLDEETLEAAALEESSKLRALAQPALEFVFDGGHLRIAEGDDADRTVPVFLKMLQYQFVDYFCLRRVVAAPAPVVDYVRHMDELDAQFLMRGHRRRKGYQPLLVEAPVGEGDERLVPATVVPAEQVLRQAGAEKRVQDALERGRSLFCLFVFFGQLLEERRGRKLRIVACNDHLGGTVNRPDRVFGQNLRCFVEHHHVEVNLLRMQELADRERAHEQARLELRQQLRQLLEQSANRQMLGLLVRLLHEQRLLWLQVVSRAGATLQGLMSNALRGLLDQLPIEFLKLGHKLVVLGPAKCAQERFRLQD